MVNTNYNKKSRGSKMNNFFLRKTRGFARRFLIKNPIEACILKGLVFGSMLVTIISEIV